MKTRQLEILQLLINHRNLTVSDVVSIYDISMRTLYYDIEQINFMIKEYGKVKISEDKIVFDGDLPRLFVFIESRLLEPYFESRVRQEIIIFTILEDRQMTLEGYAQFFGVSKTTVFSDIESLKIYLLEKDIKLFYKKKYILEGDEWYIRDFYLRLLKYKDFSFDLIDERIIKFNQKANLKLSDYSMFNLTNFTQFINKRNKEGYFINKIHSEFSISLSQIEMDIDELLNNPSDLERKYLKAYISSYTGLRDQKENTIVNEYVEKLLYEVKNKLALDIVWDEHFKQSLKNHLLASYYRIGFSFPATNPSLNDIKIRHFSLYNGIKKIIRGLEFGAFNDMREEEIGFVTSYIGGYIERYSNVKPRKVSIILVCPQGRAVSSYLKYQVENISADFGILGSYSIDNLGRLLIDYDYIITTVELPQFKNVIKVNPVLSELDRNRLLSLIKPGIKKQNQYYDIIKLIEKHAVITDKDALEQELIEYLLFNDTARKTRRQPMLSELLTENRIRKIKKVDDWKEAILQASKPLLDQKAIDMKYVDAMIGSVEKYGPYIVLADEFALPHASNVGGVNELSMSLMILDEPVDMKGKPVKIFMVLATIDNESHLKALSSMTDLISDDAMLARIKEASEKEIYEIISKEEVTE